LASPSSKRKAGAIMNKKQTNKKRDRQQMSPSRPKQKGVAELTDADLERVQGGLKLADIKGESLDSKHKGEIEVL
jgi:hypothetical protein